MKRRVLSHMFLTGAFLLSQFGFAKEHPQSSQGNQFLISGTANTPTAPSGENCEKTNQCFVFSYKGYQVSTDGRNVTLTFGIKTNCNRDLSYAAFELPAGATATATGTTKFKYKTSLTKNPFPSIKFEGVEISGYKNGVEDEFKYVLSKANFDKLTTIRVQAKAATIVGTVSFDKNCTVPQCVVSSATLTNIKYIVNGQTFTPTSSTLSAVLQKAVQQGKPVKICFTVPATSGYKTYSLVSYKAPYAVFVRDAAHLQEVFDYKTITVGPAGGTVCLEVNVPNCFYQVDFVRGCIIERLGPADTNPTNFYGVQGRLIAAAAGGTVACTPTETLGNEGCTPGYWKQEHHFGNWAPSVPTGTNATKFFDVFTVCDQSGNNCSYRGLPADLTLLEALNLGGGGFNALARHAAAAYLSATHKEVDYSMTSNEVIVGVINAFNTGDLSLLAKLEEANEKGCPLNRSELSASTSRLASGQPLLQDQQTKQLAVYPNPFRKTAVVQFALSSTEEYQVSLFDMYGKQVKQLKTGAARAGELIQINLEGTGLAEGLYLVKLVTKSQTQSVKLLLQK